MIEITEEQWKRIIAYEVEDRERVINEYDYMFTMQTTD